MLGGLSSGHTPGELLRLVGESAVRSDQVRPGQAWAAATLQRRQSRWSDDTRSDLVQRRSEARMLTMRNYDLLGARRGQGGAGRRVEGLKGRGGEGEEESEVRCLALVERRRR